MIYHLDADYFSLSWSDLSAWSGLSALLYLDIFDHILSIMFTLINLSASAIWSETNDLINPDTIKMSNDKIMINRGISDYMISPDQIGSSALDFSNMSITFLRSLKKPSTIGWLNACTHFGSSPEGHESLSESACLPISNLIHDSLGHFPHSLSASGRMSCRGRGSPHSVSILSQSTRMAFCSAVKHCWCMCTSPQVNPRKHWLRVV